MPATAIDRIDGLTTSVAVKAPCHAATTAPITLSGLQTIDGVVLLDTYPRYRVLVKDQTDHTENGIYNPYDSKAWVRAEDFDGVRDARNGTLAWVNGGSTNVGLWKVVAVDDPVVIGTSEIAWQFVINATQGTVGITTSFYDIWWFTNTKTTNGETCFIYNIPRGLSLPAGLTASKFSVDASALPTGTTTFTLYKGTASIGTIAFATNGSVTITFTSAVSFSAGQQFKMVGPVTADATANFMAFTFVFTVT